MPELRQFDPLGTSQRARQNQLVIEGQEQGLAQSAIKQDQQQKLFGQQQQVFGQQQQAFQQGEALKRAKTMNQVATAMLKLPEEQWASAAQSLAPLLKQFGLPSMGNGENLSRSKFEEIVTTTGAFVTDPSTIPTGKDFTLSPGQKRFDPSGKQIASVQPTPAATVAETPAPVLPESITGDVTPEQRQVLADVFETSGGGDKGLKQVQKQKDVFQENEQRKNAPQILAQRYPQASAEELAQMQADVDGADSVEKGMISAGKTREKQRQKKKGDGFRQRALDVVNRLLENDELDDVTGSIEGVDESSIPFVDKKFRGDNESNAIADIEEVGNILTADNLDIMTGVLSETDIKIIRSLAAGGLDRTRSDEQFRADLESLKSKLSNALGKEMEGGVLQVDANGNKAMVFPDGTFEEVK